MITQEKLDAAEDALADAKATFTPIDRLVKALFFCMTILSPIVVVVAVAFGLLISDNWLSLLSLLIVTLVGPFWVWWYLTIDTTSYREDRTRHGKLEAELRIAQRAYDRASRDYVAGAR